MELLAFWKSNKEAVLGLSVQQVLSSAGDGRLRDGSECSRELREFLRETPSENLYRYVQHCLDLPFNDSGLVLQDLINEIGRRLEFEVEDGLYRGKKTSVGYDGIWRSSSAPDIMIEVKTTDYVTISLDKIASYKQALVQQGKIPPHASVLIVVGREDTGALEAQIRGSRYAWEMRLISADRLSNLLRIKEQSNQDTTIRQIKELLQPFEYTKIDKIIDVIFATAEDVVSQEINGTTDNAGYTQVRTDREVLNAKRQAAVDALADKLGLPLLRNRQTLYWSGDKALRVCAAVSKRYERDYQPYWFAYHPTWNEFLEGGNQSYFLLACMDRDEVYALPLEVVHANLENLNTTVRPDGRSYCHIALSLAEDGNLVWNLSKVGKKIPLDPFAVPLNPPTGRRH
jgi:hypothetical protein